jgi:hypothetical protein
VPGRWKPLHGILLNCCGLILVTVAALFTGIAAKVSPNQGDRKPKERTPVGVRIRDAKLVFNVLLSEEHLEPDFHFAFIVTCSITVKNETIALALAAVFFEEHMQIQKIFGLGVNIEIADGPLMSKYANKNALVANMISCKHLLPLEECL